MRAGDVVLLALLAGAGGVIGAVIRGYAAAGRVDAPSTACAERPPGTITEAERRGRHMTYVGGPNRRGPGRPPRQSPIVFDPGPLDGDPRFVAPPFPSDRLGPWPEDGGR